MTTTELVVVHPLSPAHLPTSCISPRAPSLLQRTGTPSCHVCLSDCPFPLGIFQALPGLGRAHRAENTSGEACVPPGSRRACTALGFLLPFGLNPIATVTSSLTRAGTGLPFSSKMTFPPPFITFGHCFQIAFTKMGGMGKSGFHRLKPEVPSTW